MRDVRSGLHGPGCTLPSFRQFAIEQHISKSSAVEVYERLVALERIEAQGQQGFFVRKLRATSPHTSPVDKVLGLEGARRGRRLSRQYHPSGG